jgi:hypothetical protein
MHKKRIVPGILATLMSISLACGIISLPSQTATSSFQTTQTSYLQDIPTIYSTSTFQQTLALPQNLPTPFATVLIPTPEQEFGDSKISDNNGTVVFKDSFAHVNMNVQVQNSVTKDPIQQIEVQVIANGDNYLIVALDPAGKYLPAVNSGSFSSKTDLINNTHTSGSFLLNVIQQQEGYETVYLTLQLVDAIDNIQSLQDLEDLLRGFPSIEKWGIGFFDTCWTGNQLADAFSVGTGTLGLVLPVSGAALTTTILGDPNSGYEAGSVLSAAVAISTNLITEDAKAYLEALPGAFSFRIYYFLAPFTIRAINYLGPCNNFSASPTPTATETPPWPDSLIGIWKGTVSVSFMGRHSQDQLYLEIRRNSDGRMIVIQGKFPDIEQGDYENPGAGDGNFYYCFNNFQVIDRERMGTGVRCFIPINDSQLKFFGGDYNVFLAGVLNRVK